MPWTSAASSSRVRPRSPPAARWQPTSGPGSWRVRSRPARRLTTPRTDWPTAGSTSPWRPSAGPRCSSRPSPGRRRPSTSSSPRSRCCPPTSRTPTTSTTPSSGPSSTATAPGPGRRWRSTATPPPRCCGDSSDDDRSRHQETRMTAPPQLTVEELRADIATGAIDTVIVAFADMQGRLQGKRIHAQFFLDSVLGHGTEGCNYLLAVDVDMNTVDGYAISSWERGYGDMMFDLDLATLRRTPGQPYSATVQCDLSWLDGSGP